MLTFLCVFFLITMSMEVPICLHCVSQPDQLSGLHITLPLFKSVKSHRDKKKKNWKSPFCNLTLLFQMLSSVILLILSLFILIIAFHGNLGLLQLAAWFDTDISSNSCVLQLRDFYLRCFNIPQYSPRSFNQLPVYDMPHFQETCQCTNSSTFSFVLLLLLLLF